MTKYLISRKGHRKKNGKRDSFSLLSGSYGVFSLSRNEKINLKPNSERSQENKMLQKGHNLQCRRILNGRKLLVYFRIVVTAIFDFMTDED